jgi:SulP family sulfate permease
MTEADAARKKFDSRKNVPAYLGTASARALLPGVTAGLVSGVIAVIVEISFAALIFSGDLSSFVANGIGFTLFGACAVTLVTTAASSFPGIVSFPQDTSAALLALVAAGIAGSMPAGAPAEQTYATVVVSIVLTSLLTGVFFLLLGIFKLGRFIRFVPFPVIGGFLAGTGWLLFKGGLEVMTGTMIGVSRFPAFFQPDALFKWLPGLAFAGILLFTLRRLKHFTVLPAAVLVATGLFYLIAWFTDTPISEAGSRGWLLGLFPEGTLWRPLRFSILAEVRWESIWGQAGNIGTILIISAISMLLNISGLELLSHRDMALDRELKAAGFANLAAGIGGSPVGYHTLSLSALGCKVGSNTRLVGFVAAVVCGAALWLGADIVRIFPKFLLGGLISFLGVSFLIEWVYDAWFRLSKTDYFLVLLILVVIGVFGYLAGVGIGVLAAMFIFTANYSRIRVIHRTLSGASQRSNVDRPDSQRQELRREGSRIYILKLQGFIFFGTANTLYEDVRRRLTRSGAPDPTGSPGPSAVPAPAGPHSPIGEPVPAGSCGIRFILFDFRRVTGLDGSAEIALIKILRLARSSGAELVLTGLSPDFQHRIVRAFSEEAGMERVRFFPDLDHGIEWSEERLLASRHVPSTEEPQPLHTFLRSIFSKPSRVKKLMRYLEKREVDRDHYLIRQGDEARHLYFIESGEFAAQLELQGEEPIRLRTMREGAVFGEIALYLNVPRSLSIVATKPSAVYQLSSEALKSMERDDPDLAMAFQNYVIRLLAERLVDLNRTLEALSD